MNGIAELPARWILGQFDQWGGFRLPDARPARTLKPMTVGIGAICDGGKSAVIAADRQLSFSAHQLEIETHQSKLRRLSDRCVVAESSAGADSSLMADCFEALKAEASGLSVKQITARLQSGLQHVRQEKMRALLVRNGVDPDEFKNANMKSPTPTTESLRAEISKIQVQVFFVIVGIDNDGLSHVSEVDEISIARGDDRGFSATGSGWMHATLGFVRREFTPTATLAEAIYCTYEAKKLAESAVGVGIKTDMAILEQGKSLRLIREPSKLFKRLDEIRETLRPPALVQRDARAIIELIK